MSTIDEKWWKDEKIDRIDNLDELFTLTHSVFPPTSLMYAFTDAFVSWCEINSHWNSGKMNQTRIFLEQLGQPQERRDRLPRSQHGYCLHDCKMLHPVALNTYKATTKTWETGCYTEHAISFIKGTNTMGYSVEYLSCEIEQHTHLSWPTHNVVCLWVWEWPRICFLKYHVLLLRVPIFGKLFINTFFLTVYYWIRHQKAVEVIGN